MAEETKTRRDRNFDGLPVAEQVMVYTVSIAGSEMTTSALALCLKAGDFRLPEGRFYTASLIFEVVARLKAAGFLDPSRYLPAPGTFAVNAVRLAKKRGLYHKVNSMVKSVEEDRGLGAEYSSRQNKLLRQLWRALWGGPSVQFWDDLYQYHSSFGSHLDKHPLVRWFGDSFNQEELSRWPVKLQIEILRQNLNYSAWLMRPDDGALAFMKRLCQEPQASEADLVCLAEAFVRRGRLAEVKALVRGRVEPAFLALKGLLASLENNHTKALSLYKRALAALPQEQCLPLLPSIYFLGELLYGGNNCFALGLRYLPRLLMRFPVLMDEFRKVWLPIFKQEDPKPGSKPVNQADHLKSLNLWFHGLGRLRHGLDQGDSETLSLLCKQAAQTGNVLLAGEFASMLTRGHESDGNDAPEQAELVTLLKDFWDRGIHSYLVDAFKEDLGWHKILDELIRFQPLLLNQPAKLEDKITVHTSRLAWFLEIENGRFRAEPREQKIGVLGEWMMGRVLPLKFLANNSADLEYLSSGDRAAVACIRMDRTSLTRATYSIDGDNLACALIDHPLLFRQNDFGTHVNISRREPELRITREGQNFRLSMVPGFEDGRRIWVVEESVTQIRVIELDHNHIAIARILRGSVLVPSPRISRVRRTIANLANVLTIQSEVSAGADAARKVTANTQIHVQLLPLGLGLRVFIRVCPFGDKEYFFRPGDGGETVIVEIESQRLQTIRDLTEELASANAVVAHCPVLHRSDVADWEWMVPEPEQCLCLLLELSELKDSVVVSWPEGVKFRLTPKVSGQSASLSVGMVKDWFQIKGEVVIDEELSLDFRELLDLAARTPGNFIPLEAGRFMTLTDSFRRFLSRVNAVGQPTRHGLRIHPASVPSLGNPAEEVGTFSVDSNWLDHKARLAEGLAEDPEIPANLNAVLRDYQVDGYRWLSRMAHWGAGACLADDMGLGKTLQALCIILARSSAGPTLVVAPTSVTTNWLEEMGVFTPDLKAHVLKLKGRKALINSLGAGDVLLCSYGLLNMESDALAGVTWQTLVLDEAQAIKNALSKRATAALQLSAHFKLITTGTPVENHLGELWSLFSFLNPGMLGTRKTFNERFATPIQKYGNVTRHDLLRRIIQPYILRRLKSQVLHELPAKIEMVLYVEQSKEEATFYETLRRDVLTNLAKAENERARQVPQLLAQIMRLRRACCHPRLVLPNCSLSSSKLAVLGPLLEDLLRNQHKALIFSQFVGHLTLIREDLEKRSIRFQYLDGQTPLKERARSIEAFQAGEGDVFLISLKAGGTGLNLTAADFIIHMDPWWNPAVEDQASDRAHRIGQSRPVTVYRLVARNTIEQRILSLHKEKRELADRLLEGGDLIGKVTWEKLMALIEEG